MKFNLVILLCALSNSFAYTLSEDEVIEVSETCCPIGESAALAAADLAACSRIQPPEDLETEKIETCLGVAKSCCEESIQHKHECADGTKYAIEKKCYVPKTDAGRTCCEECSLGRWTGETQGREACGYPPGEGDTPNSAMRKNAFYQCCLEGAETEVTTEKSEKNKCTPDSCEHICTDDGGKIKCQCNNGYRLQPDKKSCVDINECAEAIDDLCNKEGTVCHNLPGSFKCVPIMKRDINCPAGFKKNTINQVCDDINECHLPRPPCPKYLCENTIGGYKCAGKPGKPLIEGALEPTTDVTGANPASEKNDNICPAGFRAGPDEECIDIDECEEHLDDCQRLSQNCINTHGSFFCQDHVSKHCAPGFKVNPATGICEDIDECKDGMEVCQRNEVCVNLPGAYDCKSKISTLPKLYKKTTCQEGTRPSAGTGTCEDINECREGSHLCDQFQNCINTYGGHECRCKNGFELDSTTSSCIDIDECALKLDDCGPGKQCLNILGSFTCTRQTKVTTTSTTPLPDDEYYYDSEETNSTPNADIPEPIQPVNPEIVTPTTPRRPQPVDGTTVTTAKPTTTARTTTSSTTRRPFYPQPAYPTYPSNRLPTTTNNSIPNNLIPPPEKPTSTENPYVKPTANDNTPYHYPSYSPGETNRNPDNKPNYINRRPQNPPGERDDYDRRPQGTYNIPATTERRPQDPYRRPEDRVSTPQNTNNIPGDTNSRTEPPRTRPEITEVTLPKPSDVPVVIEKEKTPDGVIEFDTNEIPKNTWTNVVDKEKPGEPDDINLHCLPGYEKNSRGECVDVDQCADNRHSCSTVEVCINRPGGYTCECTHGFRRDPSGLCVPVAPSIPITPPRPTTTRTTTSTTTSTTTERTTTAVARVPVRPYNAPRPRPHVVYPSREERCDFGYRFDPNVGSYGRCVDVDECSENQATCSRNEDCINVPGGYKCFCGNRCQAANKPVYPEAVPNNGPQQPNPDSNVITVGAQYGERGPKYTRPTYQRMPNSILSSCPWGYRLTATKQCIDIDECASNTNQCGPDQRCENFYGGYSCNCPNGYKLVGQDTCEDIDECQYGHPCSYNAKCINTPGSYRCSCGEGFRNAPSNEKVCVDVDECVETPSVCEQGCANAWGGYRCFCQRGYRLDTNNRTCVDVDECTEFALTRSRGRLCAGDCVNTAGTYRCSCPSGYRLSEDSRSCVDIDECENGQATCVSEYGEVCSNTRGGYHCHRINCPHGYRLESRHRCTRIQRSCIINDMDCLRQPSTYSYNFITFISNIYLPMGSVDLFTMHGPAWSDSFINFELGLISSQSESRSIQPADLSCFDIRPSNNICVVSLLCSLPGPQVIELELTMSLYQRSVFAGTAVARLVVIVSQYEF